MTKNFLIIFQDCKIVDGYFHSIIYDLTRPSNSNKIPKSLSELISKFRKYSIDRVLKMYPNDQEIILDYIDFIIANEFGIIGDIHLKTHLGLLEGQITTPEIIENSIIQVTNLNFEESVKFIQKIQQKLCSRLEVRIQELESYKFELLCNLFQNSVFRTISILSKFNSTTESIKNEILIDKEDRILEHLIYRSPSKEKRGKTNYLTEDIDFSLDCGHISQDNFSINRESFFNNQKYNSCLYKKLSLNFQGKICNCPSETNTDFQDELSNFESFLNNPKYVQLTKINKDEIEVCKDCEFRYMCLDCRIFRDSKSLISRPSKCEYNPYIGKWKGEEGFVSLNDCGVISNENGIIIDHNRISKINDELWGE